MSDDSTVSGSRWRTGEVVALRFFSRSCLQWIKPVRVVEDSDEAVALFLAADTIIKKPFSPHDGQEITRSIPYAERQRIDWQLAEAPWRENSVLMLTRPGCGRSYWAFWDDASWEFVAWYVNIQAPLARTHIGFDTEDHVLDVVIEPDTTRWSWKDEDELAEAVRLGHFTTDKASAIREEGEQALRTLELKEWPFARGWERWRPDPAWPLPKLADTWEIEPRGEGGT